jgi:hypothetical protein
VTDAVVGADSGCRSRWVTADSSHGCGELRGYGLLVFFFFFSLFVCLLVIVIHHHHHHHLICIAVI